MTTAGETENSGQTLKSRRPKSREVGSRFLSSPSSTHSIERGSQSPNHPLSPLRQKPRTSTDTRKHRGLDHGGFTSRLWPSSTKTSSTSSQFPNPQLGTLADHLGNDRLKDLIERQDSEKSDNSILLNRQRSCSEISRFENGTEIAKENRKPFFGGSMRYAGKFRFPGRSSSSSSSSQSPADDIVPGRLSVDENALRRKSFGGRLDPDTQDSESECSDIYSAASMGSPIIGKNSSATFVASTVSSRKLYAHDLQKRSARWTSDPSTANPSSPSENSPKKFTIRNAVKRANSLTSYAGATSKWALSPGRSGSPPMSVENRGKPMSFSTLKPPTSPSRGKGVSNFLSMGLELFKSKKSHLGSSVPLGDTAHQLRLLHNRLFQWRYVNARADAVNGYIASQAESNLIYAWDSLSKLLYSVVQKKLQLQKKKLEMKLGLMLCSQIKPLEAWGDMERQHLSAVSMTKDCLHSVVCKVPFIEGAKVEPQSTSITLRHASDVADSIRSMLSAFSPSAEKMAPLLSELAVVVAEEKALLEEFMELARIISKLQAEESSLKCSIIQWKLWQQQQLQRQQHITP